MSANDKDASADATAHTATTTAAAAAATTTTTSTSNTTSDMIDFLTAARGLKTTLRTGWVRQEAGPRIESVADHSWRISLMAMVAASAVNNDNSGAAVASSSVDATKCLKMALVHDLAEATVGDITPHCSVSDQDKHAMEYQAMQQLTQQTIRTTDGSGTTNGSSTIGKEIMDLWQEYEQGTTDEAKLVKDLDKLEMTLQALEYENDGQNQKSLDGFFESTRTKWRTPLGKEWGAEIESRRRLAPPQRQQPTDDDNLKEDNTQQPADDDAEPASKRPKLDE